MPSATVVGGLNVRNNITFRLCLSCVDGGVNAFVLQCGEKRFGQRVIPTHTGPPHRRPHTQPGDQRPVAFCRVDASPVGMENRVSLNHGGHSSVLQRVQDKFRAHVIGDGPANNFLRLSIDHRGRVEEPLPGVKVGDAADEPYTRPVGSKVPFHQVGHVRFRLGIGLGRDPEGAWLAWHQTLRPLIWATSSGEHEAFSPARSAWMRRYP